MVAQFPKNLSQNAFKAKLTFVLITKMVCVEVPPLPVEPREENSHVQRLWRKNFWLKAYGPHGIMLNEKQTLNDSTYMWMLKKPNSQKQRTGVWMQETFAVFSEQVASSGTS